MTTADLSQLDPSDAVGNMVTQPLFGVIAQAVNESATDIHIDTWEQQAALRFRVDGMVHNNEEPISYDEARRLINQIKVAAHMDLETVPIPQEGHFRWFTEDRCRDIRATVVAAAPVHEAAHLRLLMLPEEWHDVRNLGLGDREFEKIESILRNPRGLVLIAGPTGSGKTTTLYSLTGLTDLRGQVAASIEDPAEFDLPYVRQMEIKEHRGFTMEEGLKTILRIDADIVLVGEIRDAASATIAARAAMAGRLVLATIHARDAAMAIGAMRYLTVPNYVLGGALRLVIAQDMLRKVCPACARQRAPTSHERAVFENSQLEPPATVRDPAGCSQCFHRGYRGRTGVFQVAGIDQELGQWLAEGPPLDALRDRLALAGARPLATDALKKAARGITSMQEAMNFYGEALDRPVLVGNY